MTDKKKTKLLVKIIRCILLIFVLISLGIFLVGDFLIYHNQRYPAGDWDISNIKNIEIHTIEVEKGVKLHAWYFPGKKDKEFLIYSHGNAGNISSRKTLAKLFQLSGYSVFLFDYRGYGKSTGKPSEKGLYRDVEAVYQYVQKKMHPKKLVLFGESIGAAFSIYLATLHEFHAIILESPFASIHAMSEEMFSFRLPRFLLSSKLPSIERIKKISYPTMVIHGTNDQVVPFAHGQKIYESSIAKIKHFFKVKGVGHNGIYFSAGTYKYMSEIDTFLGKIR